MSLVDIVVVVFVCAMAAVGWERGLVGSALPLAGFVGGVALGARLAPTLLDEGARSPYAPVVAAAGGVLLGLFLAVALEGVGDSIGARLRRFGPAGTVDSLGGAALLAVLGLAAAWVFGAVALYAPGNERNALREAVLRSEVIATLNEAFPPSGSFLNVLRRIGPTPAVRGPDADVPRPDEAIVSDPQVQAASRSVVRVEGTACGLRITGSGWIAGPGLVVSNAHVVAGQDDTTVAGPDGAAAEAQVVHYDPRNDLAILSAAGMSGSPLELDPKPARGTPGAAAGYPGGGPLSLSAARLGRTGSVTSEDSYGRGPVKRRMTPFRGEVRSGNSGGPVVDGEGQVLTTVFASSLGGPDASGLGVPNDVVAAALRGRLEPTDAGPCAA